VLMSTLGTIYPTIDMTAGEKERGTMQTLLCCPIRPIEILVGKLMAVWVIATLTALVNLGSVSAVAGRMFASAMPDDLNWGTYLLCFLLILPLVVVLSALYFAICVFARDFKDAQNLVTPFYIVLSFLPAVATLPGIELTPVTAFIPIVNISLLVKALLVGEVSAEAVFQTLISSVAFGVVALLFAARVFSREQVVLGGREPLRVVLGLQRQRGGLPSPTFTLVFFAALMVVQFYASILLQDLDMLPMILGTQYGMILAPVLLAVAAFGFTPRTTFALQRPPVKGLVAALLIGISAWTFAAGVLLRLLPPPDSLSEALKKAVLLGDKPGSLALALLVIAITPAVCEELYFRGLILSGLRRLGMWPALIISALMFGILHASLYRLLPTAFLGLLLGYVVWKTGSILASILVHALNNGIAVVLIHNEARFVEDNAVLPLWLTVVGTGVMLVGIWMLRSMPAATLPGEDRTPGPLGAA